MLSNFHLRCRDTGILRQGPAETSSSSKVAWTILLFSFWPFFKPFFCFHKEIRGLWPRLPWCMEGPNKLEKTNRGVNEDQKDKPLPRGLKTGKIAQKNYLQNVSVPKKGQTGVGKEGPREDCPKNWNLFLNVLLGTVVFLTFSCKSVCFHTDVLTDRVSINFLDV